MFTWAPFCVLKMTALAAFRLLVMLLVGWKERVVVGACDKKSRVMKIIKKSGVTFLLECTHDQMVHA
jgi:hypothetical protein